MDTFKYGLQQMDFCELTWILMSSKILENKILEELSCEFLMEEDVISAFETKNNDFETEVDCCLPELDTEPKDENALPINLAPRSMVEFLDLQDIYEKVQSRAGGGSAQRISTGNVTIAATSEGQLCDIEVYVQRLPKAAVLCGDSNGKVPLQVTYEAHLQNKQMFSVDLDSVYNSSNGTPVYKLATVDAERRNLFNLVVYLKFVDGTRSEHFFSKPFLIRSRKPRSRSQSSSLET